MSLPQTYSAEEVAEAFGVSAWWLKQEARAHRIPATKLAGAWRWTEAQAIETLRIHESPVSATTAPATTAPRAPRRHPDTDASVLRPRTPRRLRTAS